MARQYPVKKGVKITTEHILEETRKIADNAEIRDDHVFATIPGMKSIELYTNGKTLFAQTENDKGDVDFSQTIKLYNQIIEQVTGYNSKERKKRFSKL